VPPESAKKEPAQSSKPVLLKRKPPSESPKEQTPEKHPLDQAIRMLEQDPLAASPPAGSTPGKLVTPAKLAPAASAKEVPRDFHPPKEGPLSETGKDALAAGQAWQSGRNTPAAGADGRVLYTYGAGLPTVICAPPRVCVIELQPGEHLTGEPHIADSVRWDISPAVAGLNLRPRQ
jgi:type IV secretion system protein VirB9